MRWTGMALIALLWMGACTPDKVYHQYRAASLTGWERNDTLSFDVPRLARGGDYDMEMGVRIGTSYPFMRLTLVVEQTVLPEGITKRDTLDCALIDQKGRELGSGVGLYQYTFPVRQWRLDKDDSLHITVHHDMKREILQGVSDVGICIRKR